MLQRRLIPAELRGDGLLEAIDYLETLDPAPGGPGVVTDEPVFVLSAGWRSGSTLVQRLLCSDGSTLIWGEPFGDRIPLVRLARSISYLSANDPHDRCSIDRLEGDPKSQWIANLNPGLPALRAAHREFCERLFARPAAERGYTRWGIKCVRLSACHALYLKWLYPRARFVFLVRDPVACYRSYKSFRDWYLIKPDWQVKGSARFFAHWAFVAGSFLELRDRCDALLLKYEDLVPGGEAIRALADHTGIKVDGNVLALPIGASEADAPKVTGVEIGLAKLLAGRVAAALGYRPL